MAVVILRKTDGTNRKTGNAITQEMPQALGQALKNAGPQPTPRKVLIGDVGQY